MNYRHITPPNAAVHEFGDNNELHHLSGGSGSSANTFFPQDWSPETVMTAATSPPKSPFRIHETGTRLLPKPREQDQMSAPMWQAPPAYNHSRAVSLPSNMLQTHFGGIFPSGQTLRVRGSISPSEQMQLISPASAPCAPDHLQPELALPMRPSIVNNRSSSTSNIRAHSRNTSTSSLDVINRFGYPYRSSPTPQPVGVSMGTSRTPSAINHLAPIPMPDGTFPGYPRNRRTASPPAQPSRLSATITLPEQQDGPVSTMLAYLTEPNPALALTRRVTEAPKAHNKHVWFDIRNRRVWSDFNMQSIANMPGAVDFLEYKMPVSSLPTPARVNVNPETVDHLAEICTQYHAVKVNAVLRIMQGPERHMAMHSYNPVRGSRQQPDFVASYQCDVEQTVNGDRRGRVVGVVKSYDQWNSGMWDGDVTKKVQYLKHLAHLHHFMREHGTRYGFIITEIEVVCVRMGGPARQFDNHPFFGYLEVAPAVQISASGDKKMTAGLALWYLHMLARDDVLEGQYHWKLDVGAARQRTRSIHLPKDAAIPEPKMHDLREAKRLRGWVMPDDPLNNKFEGGRARRGRK